MPKTHDDRNLSRRQILLGVGGTGLLAASAGHQQLLTTSPAKKKAGGGADGTPEQVHLTWGADPASSVAVSWASPGRAPGAWVQVESRHHGGSHQHGFPRRIPARERVYTDGISGEQVFTYHALVTGLRPATAYRYQVSAVNDSRPQPFEASFTTAPAGRSPFRFTSFGDLATPNTEWVLSYGQSAYVVAAVESFSPLFHLLNGDLCYANLNPLSQPEVWATTTAARPRSP
jgi:phosphodiesterase/alkaline phosphatase D-like protein